MNLVPFGGSGRDFFVKEKVKKTGTDDSCMQSITANLPLITHLLKLVFPTYIVPQKGVGRSNEC